MRREFWYRRYFKKQWSKSTEQDCCNCFMLQMLGYGFVPYPWLVAWIQEGITSKRIVDALTFIPQGRPLLVCGCPSRKNPQSSTWILSKKDLMDRLKHPESFRDTFSFEFEGMGSECVFEVLIPWKAMPKTGWLMFCFHKPVCATKNLWKRLGALKNYNLQELIHLKRWLLLMFWNTLETVMDENRSSSFLWAALEKALQLRFEIPEPKGDSMALKFHLKQFTKMWLSIGFGFGIPQNAGELEGLVDDFQKRHSFHWFCMEWLPFILLKKSYFYGFLQFQKKSIK